MWLPLATIPMSDKVDPGDAEHRCDVAVLQQAWRDFLSVCN